MFRKEKLCSLGALRLVEDWLYMWYEQGNVQMVKRGPSIYVQMLRADLLTFFSRCGIVLWTNV